MLPSWGRFDNSICTGDRSLVNAWLTAPRPPYIGYLFQNAAAWAKHQLRSISDIFAKKAEKKDLLQQLPEGTSEVVLSIQHSARLGSNYFAALTIKVKI